METNQEKLARRLLYLPLDLQDKVLLWLTYRGLKPVSEITIERRPLSPRRFFSQKNKAATQPKINQSKINRIKKWLADAELVYFRESKNAIAWHISHDKKKAEISAKILHRFDYENERQSGLLFGFPKKSSAAYAHNRALPDKKQVPMVWPGYRFEHPVLKNKYFSPYILYAIREDRVREDSQTAKLWADTIRKDVPLLAKWYEKYTQKRH